LIRINLTPPARLKNKFWFIPELVLILAVGGASYGGVQWYLGSIEDQTRAVQSETENITRDIAKLRPDIEKYEQILKQIEVLKSKLESLDSLTSSKVARFLPIILLEQLQNLKPEGLWFKSYKQNSKSQEISIDGGSFDSLLIAEFMTALDETKKVKMDITNARTFIYFPTVELVNVTNDSQSQLEKSTPMRNGRGPDVRDNFQKGYPEEDQATQSRVTDNKSFPEMDKFPSFGLNIKYAERSLPRNTEKNVNTKERSAANAKVP